MEYLVARKFHNWTTPITVPRWNELLRATQSFTNVCRSSLHAKVLEFIHLWPWKWFEHLNLIIWMGKWILSAIWWNMQGLSWKRWLIWPRSSFPLCICPFQMSLCPDLRAWKSRTSSIDFHLCSLFTEISPVSLYLLMVLCTVDDWSKFSKSYIKKHYSEIAPQFEDSFWKIAEPLPIFTSERLPF